MNHELIRQINSVILCTEKKKKNQINQAPDPPTQKEKGTIMAKES